MSLQQKSYWKDSLRKNDDKSLKSNWVHDTNTESQAKIVERSYVIINNNVFKEKLGRVIQQNLDNTYDVLIGNDKYTVNKDQIRGPIHKNDLPFYQRLSQNKGGKRRSRKQKSRRRKARSTVGRSGHKRR
jgi:hypothetical protein